MSEEKVRHGTQYLGSDGSAVVPTFSFSSNTDLGIYKSASGKVGITNDGVLYWEFSSGKFDNANNTYGPALMAEDASNTNPSVCPNTSDTDTGIGALSSGDALCLIAGAKEGMRLTEANNGVFIAWSSATSVNVTADPGSSQGDGVLTRSINIITTCANIGDAVTLPSTFTAGTIIYIKNDGANACDVFPASGDDAGAGVDTAVSIAAGDFAVFIATASNSTWTKLMGGSA